MTAAGDAEVVLDEEEIRERMSGNLCRCAAYANIVPAIAAGGPAMRPLRYDRAQDVPQAVRMLAAAPYGAYLAGGTNLVDLMKLGVATPDLLVDVRRLTSERIEDLPDGGMRSRRGGTQQRTGRRPDRSVPAIRCSPRRCSPAPRASCATSPPPAGTCCNAPAARTSRTSPRRATSGCPGRGCSAREGHHRDLAILGASPECVATHPSDLAVALAALDAVVHTERTGRRPRASR